MAKYGVDPERVRGMESDDLAWLRAGEGEGEFHGPGAWPFGIEAFAGREDNDLVLWLPSAASIVTGDSLSDFGEGLDVWLGGRKHVTREEVVAAPPSAARPAGRARAARARRARGSRGARAAPRLRTRSAADAVAHVRRERRVDDLDRLEAGIGDAVEEPLAGAEQDGDEVEDELVDHACRERLAHGRRAAGDVDSAIACGLRGARERGVEAVGDEVERRPARSSIGSCS